MQLQTALYYSYTFMIFKIKCKLYIASGSASLPLQRKILGANLLGGTPTSRSLSVRDRGAEMSRPIFETWISQIRGRNTNDSFTCL